METINPRSLNEISLGWLNAQAGLKTSTHSDSGPQTGAETLASISAFKVETVGETAGFLGDSRVDTGCFGGRITKKKTFSRLLLVGVCTFFKNRN